jgi:hypothetical protein
MIYNTPLINMHNNRFRLCCVYASHKEPNVGLLALQTPMAFSDVCQFMVTTDHGENYKSSTVFHSSNKGVT